MIARRGPQPPIGLLLRGALLAVVAAVGLACAGRADKADVDPHDPLAVQRLAVFEQIVAIVSENTAPLAEPEVDWPGAVARYRPAALAAPSTEAFYEVVDVMLRELEISHTAAMAPRRALARNQQDAFAPVSPLAAPEGEGADDGALGDAGLDFRWVDDRLVLRSVAPGSPAEAAGLKAGSSVVRLGALKVEQEWPAAYLAAVRPSEAALTVRMRFRDACAGAPGSTVDLEVLDPAGNRQTFTVERYASSSRLMSFGHLTVTGSVEQRILEGGVGYLAWDVFMMDLVPELEAALRGFKGAPAVILDLRGNPGGVAGMSQAVSGMLTAQVTDLGTMRSRDMEMRFPVFPRYGAYLGPVAILLDATSASTSEIFAGALQELGRAIVVGETSAGMVLPSLITELPDGGLLQYATALYRTPKGRVLEGVGVRPNIVVPPDPKGWARGEDPALEAAREAVLRFATTGAP